jgi:transmembrane sensor
MDVTDEIIERFFKNEASPREVEAVRDYFDQYPEQMEKYASEMERFSTGNHLHPAASRLLFKKIDRSLEDRRLVRMKLYRSVAVAASLMILAGAAWWFIAGYKGHKEERPVAGKLQQLQPTLIQVMNKSDTIMHIVLRDGSLVELEQHSGLSYYEPFINDRRDLSLKGIALFTVAKDKKRSFTVYAGGIATTALGTQFKVKAIGGGDPVTVQLYEGKVVVRQVKGSETNYLLPGQQLVFEARTQKMSLAKIEEGNGDGNKDRTLVGKKRTNPDSQDLMIFKDRPFEEVIASLEKEYKADIRYRSAAVKKINITAEFKRTETLSGILNTIATLNGLSVSQQGNIYTIK